MYPFRRQSRRQPQPADDVSAVAAAEHQEMPTTPPMIPLDGTGENIHSTDYAKRCREIMDLYRDLRDLGVHTKFHLPRIVVIGGQSSGKSSLVEAVSGINVPRDSGTCTRCPMECTLSSDARSWSCTLEIRTEYDNHGNRLKDIKRQPFGSEIVNKSEVELWVRRAQAAVLNPRRLPTDFYDMSVDQLREASNNQFSKNVVQINVKDPNATDLSFVDLPGLIQNADDHLIKTVKNLVEQYIAEKNTLIVIAMPMTDDYQNMQAVKMAMSEDADPNGNRTIGVLTKPDLLAPGSLGPCNTWKEVLSGTTYPTKHGYYCVLLPDDEQRKNGVTQLQTEQRAEEFFNRTVPWKDVEDRTRFGIPNFVGYISSLLVELIERYLPELARHVRMELLKCEREYSELPPATKGSPSTEIMLSVTAFCQDVTDAVLGVKHKRFVQANRAIYTKLKDEIVATTPDFRPCYGDGQSLVSGSRTTPRDINYVRDVIKSCITWELPGHVPFEATKRLVQEYTTMWSKPTFRCFEQIVTHNTALLEQLLRERFGQYSYLKKYIGDLTFKDRQRCHDEAHFFLTKVLALETDPLFTQNPDYLAELSRSWYSKYSTTWDRYLRDRTMNVVPHVNDELTVMASVQAYFQVSYKRFIDYIPLAIEHELNQNLANNLRNTLIPAIFEDSENGRIDLADLLSEDPAISSKRQDLKDKIRRLQKIMTTLEGFERLGLIQIQDSLRPPEPFGEEYNFLEAASEAASEALSGADMASEASPLFPIQHISF